MASETEHCGQKQIRWAADFCRGLIPTVCANIYTATDLCPASSSRLQRRQYKFSKGAILAASCGQRKILSLGLAERKCVKGFPQVRMNQQCAVEGPRESRIVLFHRPGNQVVL